MFLGTIKILKNYAINFKLTFYETKKDSSQKF